MLVAANQLLPGYHHHCHLFRRVFPLLAALCAYLPDTVLAQQSSAGWIISGGKNAEMSPKYFGPVVEQRWGQARRLSQELAPVTTTTPVDMSTTIPPTFVEWQKRAENGSNRSFGVPTLIVANNNERRMTRPAEAEEEEEESGTGSGSTSSGKAPDPSNSGSEAETGSKASSGWQQESGSSLPSSGKSDYVPRMGIEFKSPSGSWQQGSGTGHGFSKSGLESGSVWPTTSTTTPATSGIPDLLPSVSGTLPPLDLRELPELMMLFKQLPTLIKTFGETSNSYVGPIGMAKQEAPVLPNFLPSGAGIFPRQFLGLGSSPLLVASGTRLQSRAVHAEHGYGSGVGDNTVRYRNPSEKGDEINAYLIGDGIQAFPTVTKAMTIPLPRAIVPAVATHGLKELLHNNARSSSSATTTEKTTMTTLSRGPKPPWVMADPENSSERKKQQRLNIYGQVSPASLVAYMAPPPPEASKISNGTELEPEHPPPPGTGPASITTRRPRPEFDIARLSVGDLGQLENIHRKLFNKKEGEEGEDEVEDGWRGSGRTEEEDERDEKRKKGDDAGEENGPTSSPPASSPPALPRQITSSQSRQMPAGGKNDLQALVAKGLQSGQLDQSMLNELLAAGELPDLEELTRGMDLSLLNKLGGFAVLRQQFVERLWRRAMGVPK